MVVLFEYIYNNLYISCKNCIQRQKNKIKINELGKLFCDTILLSLNRFLNLYLVFVLLSR